MVDCTKNLVTVYKLGHCAPLSDMYRHYTDVLQRMSEQYTEESQYQFGLPRMLTSLYFRFTHLGAHFEFLPVVLNTARAPARVK